MELLGVLSILAGGIIVYWVGMQGRSWASLAALVKAVVTGQKPATEA
jgi:hypothetical protein